MSCLLQCCGYRPRRTRQSSHRTVPYTPLGVATSSESSHASIGSKTRAKMRIITRARALELGLKCYLCCFEAGEDGGIADSRVYNKWCEETDIWRWREVPELIFGSICACDPAKGSSVHLFCLQDMFTLTPAKRRRVCSYCRQPWYIQTCLTATHDIKPYASEKSAEDEQPWHCVRWIPAEERDAAFPDTHFSPIDVNTRFRIHVQAGEGCASKPKEALRETLPESFTHVQLRIEHCGSHAFIDPFHDTRLKRCAWCKFFDPKRDPTIGRKVPWHMISAIHASLSAAYPD